MTGLQESAKDPLKQAGAKGKQFCAKAVSTRNNILQDSRVPAPLHRLSPQPLSRYRFELRACRRTVLALTRSSHTGLEFRSGRLLEAHTVQCAVKPAEPKGSPW